MTIAIGAIVQARMSSRRLPGKVLRPLGGKPMLEYTLERLGHAREPDVVVVATSTDASDDPVAEFAAASGVACHRGPLDDVAGRFVEAAREHELDAFVRVNGDSPLLDQRLVDRAVEMFRSGRFDFVTNVMPRTFPTGASVEVAGSDFFATVYEQLSEPGDLENVTPFIYRNHDRFRIGKFESDVPYEGVRLAVDTEEDFRHVEAVLARMDRPHWDYGVDEVVAMYREVAA